MNAAKLMAGKAVLLAAAILGFVPVILSRNELGAWIYVGALIVIHVLAIAVLVARVQWRHFAADKSKLVARLPGLAILAALAGLLKFDANGNLFWWSIAALWGLHVLALPLLHVVRKREAAGSQT
jgi:hypothetical protein